jgi:hypothetical protein
MFCDSPKADEPDAKEDVFELGVQDLPDLLKATPD